MIKIFGSSGVNLSFILCQLLLFSATLPVILGLPLDGNDVPFLEDFGNFTSPNHLGRRVNGQPAVTGYPSILLGAGCTNAGGVFAPIFSAITQIVRYVLIQGMEIRCTNGFVTASRIRELWPESRRSILH